MMFTWVILFLQEIVLNIRKLLTKESRAVLTNSFVTSILSLSCLGFQLVSLVVVTNETLLLCNY